MDNLLSLQNGSDIRGVASEGIQGQNVNLTENKVCAIAASFGQWLKAKTGKDNVTVALGRDSRISGPALAKAAALGLNAIGVKVYDFGYCSTPAMFMSLLDETLDCDGSIMLTASHLPFNRNGMKFFTKDGGTDKADIKNILTNATDIDTTDVESNVTEFDFLSKYSANLVTLIRERTGEEKPFTGTKIIVDAGNGVGGFFADKILQPLGADTTGSVYLNPDGMFPNHIPNPEQKDVMLSFKQAVVDENADLGIIFDTDVDRAAVVDGNGTEINRNRLVALMANIVLEDYPASTVVTDSVTSAGLKKYIESLGGVHHRFQRGYKNVINESKRLNEQGTLSGLAIETSGHCALKENYFLDDGAYLVVKVLIKFATLKKQGKSISNLISSLEEPAEAEEIRIKIGLQDFKSYGENILSDLKTFVSETNGLSLETPNHEGVRIIFDADHGNGWCLLRMSLHDPVMPLNIESNDSGGVNIIKQTLNKFLSNYDKLKY